MWINEYFGEWQRTGLMSMKMAEKYVEYFRDSYDKVEMYKEHGCWNNHLQHINNR